MHHEKKKKFSVFIKHHMRCIYLLLLFLGILVTETQGINVNHTCVQISHDTVCWAPMHAHKGLLNTMWLGHGEFPSNCDCEGCFIGSLSSETSALPMDVPLNDLGLLGQCCLALGTQLYANRTCGPALDDLQQAENLMVIPGVLRPETTMTEWLSLLTIGVRRERVLQWVAQTTTHHVMA